MLGISWQNTTTTMVAYECVDKNPESVYGLNAHSTPTAFFELVEPFCNGLSCAPYDDKKELTCVVCTR